MYDHLRQASRLGSLAVAILVAATFAAQAVDNGGGTARSDCRQRALDRYNAYLADCADPSNGADDEGLYILCIQDGANYLQRDLELCEERDVTRGSKHPEFGGKATAVLGTANEDGNGGGTGGKGKGPKFTGPKATTKTLSLTR